MSFQGLQNFMRCWALLSSHINKINVFFVDKLVKIYKVKETFNYNQKVKTLLSVYQVI
jgi:hypothetical protein